jgi:3-phenylpropionate/trans-cinnamate dioxygenase ferredoxin subunit
MAEWVEVTGTDGLEDGSMKAIAAAGREIVLARVGTTYYAADNRCPHMGGKLSQGELNGNIVTCPLHGSQFNLSNGEVVRWLRKSGLLEKLSKSIKPPRPLTTYNVKVENNKVFIEIN